MLSGWAAQHDGGFLKERRNAAVGTCSGGGDGAEELCVCRQRAPKLGLGMEAELWRLGAEKMRADARRHLSLGDRCHLSSLHDIGLCCLRHSSPRTKKLLESEGAFAPRAS